MTIQLTGNFPLANQTKYLQLKQLDALTFGFDMTFKYGMAKNKYLEKNCKGVLPEITNEKAGDCWVYKTCKVKGL